jgi:hypothetical protein
VFAFALIFGVSAIVASPPNAEADIPDPCTFTVTGGAVELTDMDHGDVIDWFCMGPGCNYVPSCFWDHDITEDGEPDRASYFFGGYFEGTNNGCATGPYYVEMDFNYQTWSGTEWVEDYDGNFWAKVWVEHDQIDFWGAYYPGYDPNGPPDGENPMSILLEGLDGTTVEVEDDVPHEGAMGAVRWDVQSTGKWRLEAWGHVGQPQLIPEFALDVKTSIQKFVLVNVPLYGVESVPMPGYGREVVGMEGWQGYTEQTFDMMA